MNHLANLLVVLVGGGLLGFMMNTLPDYNSSFQPFAVQADESGVGLGRLFMAELISLRSAGAISYERYGKNVVRDTSATFLIAELSISAREEPRQVEAVWLGSTGRQYNQSVRLEDAPGFLSSARFQPQLTDRSLAIFELPDDEIGGGRLVLMARGSMLMDSAVHFASPASVPERQAMMRLEP